MILIKYNMWGATTLLLCSQGENIVERCIVKPADVIKTCERWRQTYSQTDIMICGVDAYNSPWRLPLQEQGFIVETRRSMNGI